MKTVLISKWHSNPLRNHNNQLMILTSALSPSCSRSLQRVHFLDAADRHWHERPPKIYEEFGPNTH